MTKKSRVAAAVLAASTLLTIGVQPARAENTSGTPAAGHGGHAGVPLRRVTPRDLKIGTAVAGGGHHLEQDYPDPFTYDKPYRRVLAGEFNSASPENQMKWEFIHPERNRYNFGPADAIVRFARRHGQVVRGHTLLWHSQNPAWLAEGQFSKAELRAILKQHIFTVVGRYRGQIHQWDVANEIFDGNGAYRQENIWIRELGPGIVADAFRWAHQADPRAQLFLNDYGVEWPGAKVDAYEALAEQLLADRVPLHGFASQAHLSMRYGAPDQLRAVLQRFDDLGLYTAITELDVRMDLPESGVPTAEQLTTQAQYYKTVLDACLAVDDCNSFTLWGFTDKYSWVPVFFPTEGAATVMWDDFTRKPAYETLQQTLAEARG
ncbi:endo-1,4-beta-xylanase [Actinoplanes campanulatus]|uniref:Beta-xylanase n=1 Tax=Actinoplanes campanulatus TaxID=113559 RepID=A0A7W5AIE1_9ACTN|nr:endo-1,4-beta-xylanase [Actinoplanes campanulatus]MBB3096650.1 endo-1,4-beta-xylanase [Actinoplanes campanulatus]GGN30430.1 beta-xylanase [Actinoplanes campanulatus]GID37192.1 beta-xylanase [Actinoplanes campanulatus]